MPSITTPAAVRKEGNLSSSVLDDQLEQSIKLASIEVKKLLTAEVYTEVESEAGDNTDRYLECSQAAANLAMSYAVITLNIETAGTGIVRSKGFGETRSELLSQNEAQRLSDHFRQIAMNLLKPYLPAYEGDPDDDDDDDDILEAGSISLGAI